MLLYHGGGHPKLTKDVRPGLKTLLVWDERTCAWAAQSGHLHVLQWACAQDPSCLWENWTCVLAAVNTLVAIRSPFGLK
jgi:hypothetical protein